MELALRLAEEKINGKSREIQNLKLAINEKEKNIAKMQFRTADLEGKVIEEKSQASIMKRDYEHKLQECQNQLKEKDKEVFLYKSREASGNCVTSVEVEKLKVKNELEAKYSAEIRSMTAKVSNLEYELSAKRAEVVQLKHQLNDKNQSTDQRTKELVGRHKLKAEDLKAENEKLEMSILNLKSELANKDFQIQKLTLDSQGKTDLKDGQIESLKLQLDKLKKEKSDVAVHNTLEASKLKEENRKLKLERDKLSIEKAFLDNELKAKKDYYQTAENELAKIKKERSQGISHITELEAEIRQLKEDLVRKGEKLEGAENEYKMKAFRDKSDLELSLEMEKKKVENLNETLRQTSADWERKLAKLSEDLKLQEKDNAGLSEKLNKAKAKKAELAQRVKHLELENHKWKLTHETSVRSMQELEEALNKSKTELEENEDVRRQASQFSIIQREMDMLKEKLAESQSKIHKLKGKLHLKSGEATQEVVGDEVCDDDEMYRQLNERMKNELYGYSATRFCEDYDTVNQRIHQLGISEVPVMPIIREYIPESNPRVELHMPGNFDATLPKTMTNSKVTTFNLKSAAAPPEITIIDQSDQNNLNFGNMAQKQVDSLLSSHQTPKFNIPSHDQQFSMKDRLSEMIKSGDYIFNS